jgi:hypothetical protein
MSKDNSESAEGGRLSRTTQSNNVTGGDVVAGDKIQHSFTMSTPSPAGGLMHLLKRLQEEQRGDARAQEMIDELKRFTEPKERIPIGVEQKLTDGGRTDLIAFALQAKEDFAKKLAQNTFFESAQEIHALFLSRIYSVFSTRILPMIRDGAHPDVVNTLIQTWIIEPTVAELQQTPFRYYDDHVQGMLFYLTGNCHIVWV